MTVVSVVSACFVVTMTVVYTASGYSRLCRCFVVALYLARLGG